MITYRAGPVLNIHLREEQGRIVPTPNARDVDIERELSVLQSENLIFIGFLIKEVATNNPSRGVEFDPVGHLFDFGVAHPGVVAADVENEPRFAHLAFAVVCVASLVREVKDLFGVQSLLSRCWRSPHKHQAGQTHKGDGSCDTEHLCLLTKLIGFNVIGFNGCS